MLSLISLRTLGFFVFLSFNYYKLLVSAFKKYTTTQIKIFPVRCKMLAVPLLIQFTDRVKLSLVKQFLLCRTFVRRRQYTYGCDTLLGSIKILGNVIQDAT